MIKGFFVLMLLTLVASPAVAASERTSKFEMACRPVVQSPNFRIAEPMKYSQRSFIGFDKLSNATDPKQLKQGECMVFGKPSLPKNINNRICYRGKVELYSYESGYHHDLSYRAGKFNTLANTFWNYPQTLVRFHAYYDPEVEEYNCFVTKLKTLKFETSYFK